MTAGPPLSTTSPLFRAGDEPERIRLPGADLAFWPALALGARHEAIMTELADATPWRCDEIRMFGKRYRQPRLTAWYGDPGAGYRYSGIELAPLAWTERLADLRDRVGRASGTRFNSVLLNLYRDQNDSMGMHADDEPELGRQPVIASLSLGAERTLNLRHRHDPGVAAARLALPGGSLLLMCGDTQRNWKHGIAKQRRACGPRLNLTFRRIVS